MAFFELVSEITIGIYTFTGVHDVRVKKGIYSYIEMAWIKLPAKGFIQNGVSVQEVTTGNLFQEGDKVVIKLGYNGDLKTEFEGFVRRINMDMPLEVECEGYVRQLRLSITDAPLSSGVKIKKLLKAICRNTDIKVQCTVDYTLFGRTLTNSDGCKVIEEIKRITNNALAIFFIEPKVIWCGLLYTPYLAGTKVFDVPTVNYWLGHNVVKDNSLKQRVVTERVQIIMNGLLVSGDTVWTKSDEKAALRKVKYTLNGLRETAVLKEIANENEKRLNYQGYEGSINAFLQPFAQPGYDARIEDSKYPQRTGIYLIESTEVTFGVSGARRKIGIGPKLG